VLFPHFYAARSFLIRRSYDVAVQSSPKKCEFKVLFAGADCALLSLFVGNLSNTLLVQLWANRGTLEPSFSVYAVYREDSMTFEIIARLDNVPASPVETVLRAFIEDQDFHDLVIAPLIDKVREHFVFKA
jgi:hypothetical protein